MLIITFFSYQSLTNYFGIAMGQFRGISDSDQIPGPPSYSPPRISSTQKVTTPILRRVTQILDSSVDARVWSL